MPKDTKTLCIKKGCASVLTHLLCCMLKYQIVGVTFSCAITKTQKITFYYVEKNEGMLRSSQIMIKFAAICNVEFAK